SHRSLSDAIRWARARRRSGHGLYSGRGQLATEPKRRGTMVWAPRIYDLTRPMNHDTLVALAGKLAVGDGPVKDLEFSWLRSWERGDNGAQCQWTLNDHFGTHVDAP